MASALMWFNYKTDCLFKVHQSTRQEGSYYLYCLIFYGFIDITCHVFLYATPMQILVLFICYLSSILTKTFKNTVKSKRSTLKMLLK